MSHDSDTIRKRLRRIGIKPNAANVARVQRSEAAVGPGERNKKCLEDQARERGELNVLRDYRDPSRSVHAEAFRDPKQIAEFKRRVGADPRR